MTYRLDIETYARCRAVELEQSEEHTSTPLSEGTYVDEASREAGAGFRGERERV